MTKHVIGGIAAALFAVFLSACQTEAIYDVNSHPVTPATQAKLSDTQVAKTIVRVVNSSPNWQVEGTEPGKIHAKWRRHNTRSANVDILFSNESYSILLISSVELYQEGGVIHPSYNSAVHKLEVDIDRALLTDSY